MRIGVLLLPADPWPVSVARVQLLESLGYHHIWTYDHVNWRWYRDRTWHTAIPWLTGMATATSRVRLGTMVTSPNFRHPLTLGKDTISLDHISDGRMILGVGSGGVGFDATMFNEPVLSVRDQLDRFAEFLDVLDGVLGQKFIRRDGRWYPLEGTYVLPVSVQRPRVPLVVAAGGPRALALTARYADGWVTWGDRRDDDQSGPAVQRAVRRQIDELERACAAIRRDPATIQRYYLAGNTAERILESIDVFEDFVGRYREMGFNDLVFHDPRPGDERFDGDPDVVLAIAERLMLAGEPAAIAPPIEPNR
jgi:alkanesulfonate monooxygenase SsuD/methylene tetrahydromethanopterin reductase-like flavin-dependent oxidoreductase (luciferase family)